METRRLLARFVPGFLKPVLRPLYERALHTTQKLMHRPKSRNDLHSYWRRPPDAGNKPTDYLEGGARSQWLVELAQRHLAVASPGDAATKNVLEIGCNIGRNLNAFERAGFHRLSAIEINAEAIELLKQHFPNVGKAAQIYVGPVEEAIKTYDAGQFDLVYTMAVLEHIHRDSEWIFTEMVRITRHLIITIEDERGFSERHFPRCYDKIFTELGMTEIESHDCTGIEGLGTGFVARVFRKP
jgi:2-polyprenyl-3-methyl-5-hydroxy-6-metoxy-1,4-benzoquinol methylase